MGTPMTTLFGNSLPDMRIEPPGPESRRLAENLAHNESPGVSTMSTGHIPIVWTTARGANVIDADGNVYIDLSGAFGVASIGHNNPKVRAAIRAQSRHLIHSLADVHPSNTRVQLAERLATLAPVEDAQVMFANTGAEAVELAMKTSSRWTGHHRFIAFEGAYHGVSYGALAATHRHDFREPYEPQLHQGVVHVPYPNPTHRPDRSLREWLEPVAQALAKGGIAGVLVEPVQGRGGEIVPPKGFLSELQKLCRIRKVLLIVDEMITGFGRTGRWFAVDHEDVRPDLICLGKAMGGGMPLSACVGRREVMDSWRYKTGEAPHASTFMDHPLSSSAALATLNEMERLDLPQRANRLGRYTLKRLGALSKQCDHVLGTRGLGLMIGIELAIDSLAIADACLQRGVIVLGGGPKRNVLSLTPPITITQRQLNYALMVIEETVRADGQVSRPLAAARDGR